MTALPNPEDFSELAPGWTAAKKLQFLDHLAQRGNVRAACAQVGMSREAAYRLRRRDEGFARGWAAAMVLANHAASEILADRAIDGIEEEVWLRGEVVGSRRKFDTRLFLAHLARLDKAAECQKAQADAARFDELLAVIAGERARDELLGDIDVETLPITREESAERSADAAEAVLESTAKSEDRGEPDEDAREYARWNGRQSGFALHDEWLTHARGCVDRLLEGGQAEITPRTVSDVSTAALAAGLANAPVAGLTNCSPDSHDLPAPAGDKPDFAAGERR